MCSDDDDQVKHDGGSQTKPTRDSCGRWLKGHCPNPKGRPPKTVETTYYQGDIRHFGNTIIEVRTNGKTEQMDRRTALFKKVFEDAMKGKVTSQRFLYNEFKRNDERLAGLRHQYQTLMMRWVINNPNFDGLDGENIPIEVQLEILGLESLLHHYFPEQYPCPPPPVPPRTWDDDED